MVTDWSRNMNDIPPDAPPPPTEGAMEEDLALPGAIGEFVLGFAALQEWIERGIRRILATTEIREDFVNALLGGSVGSEMGRNWTSLRAMLLASTSGSAVEKHVATLVQALNREISTGADSLMRCAMRSCTPTG